MEPTHPHESPAKKLKRDVVPRSYFDVIPPDVLSNIARSMLYDGNLFNGTIIQKRVRNYDNVYPFVYNNEAHRHAVLSACKYTLSLNDFEEDSASSIVELFGDHAKVLNLYGYPSDKVPHNLALPNLQRASVCCTRQQLGVLKACRDIIDLAVKFTDSDCMESLLEVLQANPVNKLTFQVGEFGKQPTLLENHWQKRISAACHSVTNFTWLSSYKNISDYMTFVTGLKRLEILAVYAFEDKMLLDDKNIPFLKKLKEVFLEVGVQVHQALKLGPSVRSLVHAQMTNADTVTSLGRFPNLCSIGMILMKDAEKGLLSINLSDLRILELQWGVMKPEPLNNIFEGPDMNYIFRDNDVFPEDGDDLHEPNEGVILDIIGRAINLRSLSLINASISIETALKIVQQVGNRLESFGMSLDERNHSIPLQVEKLLGSISRHCKNMAFVLFLTDNSSITTAEQKEKCMDAFRQVKYFCPRLRSMEQISRMISRFVIEE